MKNTTPPATQFGPAGSVAALAFHVLAGLRWAGAPRATYRALLQAPQMAWWKLRLWLRVLARPDEVRWTRTQRNQPSPLATPGDDRGERSGHRP